MLDISIPELVKKVTTEKKALELLNQDVVITEKFDGTKLTLIRTDTLRNPDDYAKNWIVAYKGNVIFPEEQLGVKDDMLCHSIGVCQYKRVFDLLRNVPSDVDVPLRTEIFIEFIQNKATLTRDYERYGDLYVIGYALDVDYVACGMHVYTTSEKLETINNDWFAATLGLKQPPVVFSGRLSPPSLETVTETVNEYSDHRSILGGRAEGVVITLADGQRFKVVAPDQYDKETRKQKKSRYALFENHERTYWKRVRELAGLLVKRHWDADIGVTLGRLSRDVYLFREDELPKNNKRNVVIKRDDLMLTSKMVYEEQLEIKGSSVGLIPLAGRPFHEGHRFLLEAALKECDTVYLFVSVKGRGEGLERIEAGRMLKAWKDLLLPKLDSRVVVRFCESPVSDAHRFVKNVSLSFPTGKLRFTFFGDVEDVNSRWDKEKLRKLFPELHPFGLIKTVSFRRADTVQVSGTQMREWLGNGDREQFLAGLPQNLTLEERAEYFNILAGS